MEFFSEVWGAHDSAPMIVVPVLGELSETTPAGPGKVCEVYDVCLTSDRKVLVGRHSNTKRLIVVTKNGAFLTIKIVI